jgi:hypothetical protein
VNTRPGSPPSVFSSLNSVGVSGSAASPRIRRIALGRHEQDRDVRLLAELEAEADPVDARHHDVEAHEVRAEAVEHIEGLTRVRHDPHGEPLLAQDRAQKVGDVRFVIDDEDARVVGDAALSHGPGIGDRHREVDWQYRCQT